MSFTIEQLKKGEAFLTKHNLDDLIYSFKIPQEWNENKQISCIDEFCIYKHTVQTIKYKSCIFTDKDQREDMTFPLIQEVFGSCTCKTWAKYLYELIIYVKKIGDEENKRLRKSLKKI